MNNTLCFSSLGCPGFSLEELCSLCATSGIDTFELRSLDHRTDYPAWLAQNPADLEKTSLLLEKHRLKLASLGSSFNLTAHQSKDIGSLLEACRVADVLGSPWVRIFGGGSENESMPAGQIRQAAQLYREARDRCRDGGRRSVLIVETHGGLVGSEIIARFCDAAGEAVPLLWDSHHTWKLGGEKPSDTFAAIRPLVRHIHVKDSRSVPSAKHSYGYVPPGQGEFPFSGLFELLRKDPIDAVLSLEWEKQWHPELPPLEEALAAWKKIFPV